MEPVKVLGLVFLIGVMLHGSHGTCPNYQKSHCKVHPCAAKLCGPGETCVADFCGGCKASCEPIPGSCLHTDGNRYEDGAKFPAGDGCNTCHCDKGAIGCTEVACDVCQYNGNTYKVGRSFPSTDGCNTCTCGKGGIVGCTKIHCPCPPDKPLVYCFVDPCLFKKCGYGKKCVSDYCGGCRATCERVPKTCKYEDGKTYNAGDIFPSVDGCNTCTCTGLGGVSCTRKACPPKSCHYNGKKYRHGAKFEAIDGCNTCTCDNGAVGCTEKACVTTCKFGDKIYKSGESFPAGDGCNVCSCRDDGEVVCTLLQCLPKSCHYNGKKYRHGEEFKAIDKCNTCTCDNGAVGCTEKACVCPLRKCLACPNGYKKDDKGCQTCECLPTTACKRDQYNRQVCKKDQFCNGSECCPKWTLVARCSDPCKNRKCDRRHKCERYCGCFSRCVRK